MGLRSLYTDEVVDSHQIMMMNDYMPTKVNNLYKALLPLPPAVFVAPGGFLFSFLISARRPVRKV